MKVRGIRFLMIHGVRCSVLLLLAGLVSCRFASSFDETEIFVPTGGIPCLGGGEAAAWDLSWLDEEGRVRYRRVSGGERIRLDAARERPLVVRAVPESPFDGSYRMRPAGCVVPAYRTPPAGAALRWEDGFAADFLLSLAESGVDAARIDVARFGRTARERGMGNPWDLDTARLAADVAAGTLWVYSFRLRDSMEVVIPLPPGIWYGDYPPDDAFVVESGYPGSPGGWPGVMRTGLHRFVRPSDGLAATASIDADGRILVLFDG